MYAGANPDTHFGVIGDTDEIVMRHPPEIFPR